MTINNNIIPSDLRQILEGEDFELNGGGLVISSVIYTGNDLEVLFKIKFQAHNIPEQNWKIDISEIEAESISRSWTEELTVYDDHFLLYEFLDSHIELYYNNKADDSLKLLADIFELHKNNFDNRLPFAHGINFPLGRHRLCNSSNGLFARGPKRILELYWKCLNSNGVRANFVNEIPSNKSDLKLLEFGDSYFIGKTFLFSRQ